MPTISPPMTAPGMESSPPRITTGNTLKPTSERFTSTPSRLPQMMPPRAETMPVIAQARPKYRSTLMPMAMATCWLSATARMAMPLRDLRKNHPKVDRKIRLTPAPSTWMGGMNSGPMTMGSSGMGSGSDLVPAPMVVGPTPRRIEARPMVAMTTAITGRPMSLRSMTRSRAKPKATMPTMPSAMASHRGACITTRLPATTSPAIITNSPWAKFTASVALYTSTKPRAISAYISPIRIPFETSSRKNPKSSPTGGHPLDVLDLYPGSDRRLPPVLVGHRGGQLHLVLAAVEGLDDLRVLLRDEAPPHLAGAGHLGVVGVEILGQEQEAPDPGGVGQRRVGLGDLLGDQAPDLRLLGEVHVARIGNAPALRPVPDGGDVDGDHRHHERPVAAEAHRLPHVGA